MKKLSLENHKEGSQAYELREHLELEKLKLEIKEKKRNWLLRLLDNPQQVLTVLGAVIGIVILTKENYYRTLQATIDLKQQQAAISQQQAESATRHAAQEMGQADQRMEAAKTKSSEASAIENHAKAVIVEANAKARSALEKEALAEKEKTSIEAQLKPLRHERDAREAAAGVDEFISLGMYDAAQGRAIDAWRMQANRSTTNAVVTAFSWPINTFDAGSVADAQWAPDSRHVITLSGSTRYSVWDIAAVRPLWSGTLPERASIAFSSTDRILVAGDSRVDTFDMRTGHALDQFPLPEISKGAPVTLSHDGSLVAARAGSQLSRLIGIWDLRSNTKIAQFESDQPSIVQITFSPNNNYLVTTGEQMQSTLWETKTGKSVVKSPNGARPFSFSIDGQKVVYVDERRQTILLDLNTGQQSALASSSSSVCRVGFSRQGDKIAIALGDGSVVIRYSGVRVSRPALRLPIGARCADSIQFSPDGRYLLVAEDSKAQIWGIETPYQNPGLSGEFNGRYKAEFSPDGSKILALGYIKQAIYTFAVPENVRQVSAEY